MSGPPPGWTQAQWDQINAQKGNVVAQGGPNQVPTNLIGQFPSPMFATYNPITAAPYKFTNPQDFASQYGQFNRDEMMKNYNLSSNIAMGELDQELKGLNKYAPAAAALQRQQTTADNQYNQGQRTSQIGQVMPGAAGALNAQFGRANAYASGRMPSSVEDRALELGIRSTSADQSAAGGFGVASSAAQKSSSLMSAQQRMQMSQYGDQLLGQNLQTTNALMMAPTEYSNAGSQIRTMPEVGGARLTAGALSEADAQTMIPTTAAFQGTVQQNQFTTGLEQQTRQFNASNELQASEFNAGVGNQFALDKFGYQVGYAGVQAGTASANNNWAVGAQQQGVATQQFQDYASQAQNAQMASSAMQLGGALLGSGGLTSAVSAIGSLFSPNNTYQPGGTGMGSPGPSSGTTYPNYDTNSPAFSAAATDNGAYVQGPTTEIGGSAPADTGGSASSGDWTFESAKLSPQATGYQTNLRDTTGLNFDLNSAPGAEHAVMRNAGMSTDATAIPRSVPVGSNYQGQTVYSNPDLKTATDTTVGSKVSNSIAAVLQPLGALTPDETAKIQAIGKTASDPTLLANLSDKATGGDTNGFIDTLASGMGMGGLSGLQDAQNPHQNNMAYSAAGAMQTWNQASPEQQSIMAASLGLQGMTDADGKSLGEKVIPATQTPGTQPANVGQVLGWMGQGINSYPLTQKWDQYSALSKFVNGTNEPNTVARTAAQANLLGAGQAGAEVPGVTAEKLSSAGWSPAAHLGVGAVVAKEGTQMPQGYTRVASDGNQILAAPKGTAYSARSAVMGAAAQGTGAAAGMTPSKTGAVLQLSSGALNIINQWQGGDKTGAAVSAGLMGAGAAAQASGVAGAPAGVGAGAGAGANAYNAYLQMKGGNNVGAGVSGSQASIQAAQAYYLSIGDKAAAQAVGAYAPYVSGAAGAYNAYNAYKAGDKTGAAAGLATTGAAVGLGAAYGGTVGAAAGAVVGSAYSDMQTVQQQTGWNNTASLGGSALLGGVMGLGGPTVAALVAHSMGYGGNGNPDRQGRDAIRDNWSKNNFLTDSNSNVTLADGSKVNIGTDGNNDMHSFTDPSKVNNPEEVDSSGKLHSYDVDYTNELDYASSMGGMALSRLVNGGKATNVDQIGGQLGNAAISNIGYNKPMTEQNFNSMIANQKAMYSKAGIGSKQDVYQLANTAYAQGRMNEFDHTQALQAADMIFDKNGYQTAQKLMGGRWSGIQNNADTAAAAKATPDKNQPAQVGSVLGAGMGSIGAQGPSTDPGYTAGMPTGSYFKGGMPEYKQPPMAIPRSWNMSKADIQARNASLYSSQAA